MAGKRTGENWLSARAAATLGEGDHADGGGLYLQVRGASRTWLYRYQLAGRRREMGLGSMRVLGLADARAARDAARRLVKGGVDPIEARGRAQAAVGRLWGTACADLIARLRSGWKNDEQQQQWEQSLRDYGPRADMPVVQVDTEVVLACLQPIWKHKDEGGKVETATRVRGRIERVWDAEKVRGTVSGENPARWKGHLEHLLPKRQKVQPTEHFAAMPYHDLPDFIDQLGGGDSITRRALMWTIFTAARTEETLGLEWSELDLRRKLWTIPAWRMKMGKKHQVPLTDTALAQLDGMPRDQPPFALSENAMLNLVQYPPTNGFGLPYTVHGFRSTFFDWAHEEMAFPKFIVDMALAHKVQDKADAAYRHGELLKKRRDLMEAWERFALGQPLAA